MPDLTISLEQRDLLRNFAVYLEEAIEEGEGTVIGLAVLSALGWDAEGDRDVYTVPASPEIRAFLTEVRDVEWENLECDETTDRQRSEDTLVTAERLLLDLEPGLAI